MGSGLVHSCQRKYLGTAADQSLSLGFQAKTVHVRSADGEVYMQMGMDLPFKRDAAGAASFLAAADMEITETGLVIKGSDAALNADGTEYYLEVYS